jgi:uncharacterized membrane protein YciS (DUF1049 family)
MKQHFRGTMSTLVILMDGLVLAVVVIGLFWFAGRVSTGASANEATAPAARVLTVESR